MTDGLRERQPDRLDQAVAAAFACKECGKEHTQRDISVPGRIAGNGQPIKQFTWADPVDGHAYRMPIVDAGWLRRFADTHPKDTDR